jgi:SH3 domain protein
LKLPLIFAAIWLIAAHAAQAETIKYIRDMVYVPVRSGPSIQHRILRNAESGTPLVIVAAADASGYARVRTEDGLDGWIEEQYLIDRPIARELLGKAEAEAERLRQQNQQLRQELQSVRTDQGESTRTVAELKSAGEKLREELEQVTRVSGNAIAIDGENRQLREQVGELTSGLESLSAERDQLRSENRSRAFMQGAYAVAIGVIIALLVPRLWPRRRRSEWN